MADRFSADRDHLPIGGCVLESAVRNSDTTSDEIGNVGGQGLIVVFDVTAVPGGDFVTLFIQGKDPCSGKFYTMFSATATDVIGTTVLQIAPALPPVVNSTSPELIPGTWRVFVDHSGAGSFTYSVGATLTP